MTAIIKNNKDNIKDNVKIAVFSLGCKTNYYEGMAIASRLNELGLNAVEGLVPADVYVINTCAVTAEAEGKSRQCISRALKLNKEAKIFLVGCAVEHDKEQFLSKERVVYLAGNADKMKVAEKIAFLLAAENTYTDTRHKEKAQDYAPPAHKLFTDNLSEETADFSLACEEGNTNQRNKAVWSKVAARRQAPSSYTREIIADSRHNGKMPLKTVEGGDLSADKLTALTNADFKNNLFYQTPPQENTGCNGFIKAQNPLTSAEDTAPIAPDKPLDFSIAPPSRARRYVKIQDGCDNFCSYCIVPYLRGRSASRSIKEIVQEVKGVKEKEIVLIGIDISQFGRENGETLAGLFDALDFFGGRIRLGSLYQNAINEKLLIAMKGKGCAHFHLSLQSGCDQTLKRMNRHYTAKDYFNAVTLIRSFYPDAAICADVIVGFCGESAEEFAQTYDFIEKVGFADVHIFPYSPRKGTAAYAWKTPSGKEIGERVEKLTLLKNKLTTAFTQKALALKEAQVLIEEEKGGYSIGYTDNYVKVYIKEKLQIGEFANVIPLKAFKEGMLAAPAKI